MKIVAVFILALFCMLTSEAQYVPAINESPHRLSSGALFAPTAKAAAVNVCDTWTFQVQLSSSAGERPTDAVQLPGNNYIIAGSDSSAAGVRARLLKLNAQGAVLQSKAFALPGWELTVQRLRLFSDGNLWAVGTASEPVSGSLQPLLFCVDTANLTLLSVWSLQGTGAQPNWRGVDLNEGRDHHVFVLTHNSHLLNVTKISYTQNSIRWSKTYRPRNSPRPVGIGVEYDDVFVAWNETDGDYSKGVMMNLRNATGEYKFGSRVGGGADKPNITLQSMTMVNLRPRITALQWKDNSFQAIRMNYETMAYTTFKEAYSLNGFSPAADMRSQQDDWGQALGFQAGAKGNDISVVRTYPDNQYTPIRSWQLHYNYPVVMNRLISTNDGGSLLVNRTAVYPERIVLTKTDSVTTLPGCRVTAQPASSEILRPVDKLDTIPEEGSAHQLIPLTLATSEVALSTTTDCKSLYCPVPPQPDSCQRTFFKEYRNNTNSIVGDAMISIGSGKFLQQSRVRGTPYVAVEQTQFTIFDTAGRLVESHILVSPQPITLLTLTQLRDGNLLGTGIIRTGDDPHDIYLFKFNPQFSILWQKKLVTAVPPHFNAIATVMESSEGDLYCYLADRITAPLETRTLLKLDASGNPLWMQQYSIGPTVFASSSEHVAALTELEDAVILKYNDEDSDYSPYLMRIHKKDGSVVWVRKYQMPGPYGGSGSYSLRALLSDGRFLYMSGLSQERNVLLKIKPDGSVALAKRTAPTSAFLGWMGFKPGGRLMTSVGMWVVGGSINGALELDTNFTILRTQYMKMPRGGRNGALVPYSDSVTYAAGSLWYDNHYWASLYFQKYNFNSSFASCAVNDALVVLDEFTQPVTTKQINTSALALPQMAPYNASFSEGHLAYSGFYCGNNTECATIALKGPSEICGSDDTYSYRVNRNKGCDGNVLWRIDTASGQLQILSMTDSLLQVKVLRGGTFRLQAKVFANCGWLEDSLAVQATIRNSTLNLGKDTSLCPGNNYTLRAGPDFGSYRWQDGSTDSLFVVKQPGLYWVQVTSCGNIYRDSVVVKAAPPIPFSAGPDRTKCNRDTLLLSAPPGFLNYTWSNNYQISSQTAQTVVVNPLVDTAYYVRAEKTLGCFAYDTVRITVYHSPVIELGRDTSFCFGDSVVLNAGGGFHSFLWNDGSTAQTFTATTKGAYSVTGITQQGCKSYDTLRVQQVIALPVVQLEKFSALCEGESRTLNAGNFASYQWQDGSTAKTFTISGVGRYYVTVTDSYGCTGSDTTMVRTIHSLPQSFLPADTAICTYDKLELKSLSTYQTYAWSTGGSGPSITISQPGLYWLQVQDNNHCKGRDSIRVLSKDCMSGFFAPTAFTPNGDGKNDVFRPLLFGNVKQYRFTVYNRWGEVVYQTTEREKGWNGKVAGILQESSVFVWTCTYQMEGDVVKMEKGSVMLVR